jgi:ABC-type amino acid transport substrate-binding protein
MECRLRQIALLLAWTILGLPSFVSAEQQPLRVGSRIGFPPYVDIDAQGRSTGFAVELFTAVAKVMDIPVSFQPGRRDTTLQSLKAGEFDGKRSINHI